MNRIVFKVGTSTLTYPDGELDIKTIDRIARVLSSVRNAGNQVILVSSGAIAVGCKKMRLSSHPTKLSMKQAAAAVGQCELMHIYDKLFGEYGNMVAQVLLTDSAIENEESRENLKRTFDALLENNMIPIVNENDSVSYSQIESDKKLFGDNDTLSAVVAVFTSAEKLILLSDIDGMYDKDPTDHDDAVMIKEIPEIDDKIRSLAHESVSGLGTGGMITKLEAAQKAMDHGIDTYIINGKKPQLIYDLLAGIPTGTHFCGSK